MTLARTGKSDTVERSFEGDVADNTGLASVMAI